MSHENFCTHNKSIILFDSIEHYIPAYAVCNECNKILNQKETSELIKLKNKEIGIIEYKNE